MYYKPSEGTDSSRRVDDSLSSSSARTTYSNSFSPVFSLRWSIVTWKSFAEFGSRVPPICTINIRVISLVRIPNARNKRPRFSPEVVLMDNLDPLMIALRRRAHRDRNHMRHQNLKLLEHRLIYLEGNIPSQQHIKVHMLFE